MRKDNLEMAWNEPQDERSTGERNPNEPKSSQKPGEAPDLDEVLKGLKRRLSGAGGGNKRGNLYRQGRGGKGLGPLPFVVGGIALLAWLATGIYKVNEGTKSVELFLGKYSKTKNAGLTWRLPNPIADHQLIDIQRLFSQKIVGDNGRDEASMLTKDEAIVSVKIEVQYQIDAEHPEKFWFASINPHVTMQEVVVSAARERVGQMILDDVLTEGRERLTREVKELSQSVLDRYGIGLVITNINLEDAQPPEQVQEAFSDAIRAREDEQKRINEAETYRDSIIAEVRGEVEREIRRAEAYRDTKVAQAQGEANRYTLLLEAYEESPEVTRERLYLETIEGVLGKSSKIIMGQGKNNNLMMLPLDQVLKGAGSAKNSGSNRDNDESIMKERLNEVTSEPSSTPRATPQAEEPERRGMRTGGQGRSGNLNR